MLRSISDVPRPVQPPEKNWRIEIVNDIDPNRGYRGYPASMHRYAMIQQGAGSATFVSSRFFAGMLWWAAAAGIAQAGDIYRSIDANGNVVYSDHAESSTSQSTAVQIDNSGFPPRELHFCWTNCFTLILESGVYRRADGTDESWTVETFSAKAIVLHRHDAPADWNENSQDVVYAGHVSNDRLIGVTINGKPVNGIEASWGAALNSLPGSNAERNATGSANPDSSSSGAVSSAVPPPPLPAEDQPTLPADGLLWTPGYWYWQDQAYIWIPGAWVRPPRVGLLWTPAYWGLAGAVFVFHPGHWGTTVGFYGGVHYGYGYWGNGYAGGHWIGNLFAYNSAENHLSPAVALHRYAESGSDRGPQHVFSYSGAPNGRASMPTVLHQSSPRAASNAAAPPAVMRLSKPAPETMEPGSPSDGAKTRMPSTPPKSNHIRLTRTEPVK